MKNYYDELEISSSASKEVIEKVYKVLAKKYHPDTTEEPDKKAAEEKFKIISEAYEILSDDEKRKKYDLELEEYDKKISYEEYMNVVNQKNSLNNELYNLKNNLNNSNYSNTPNNSNYTKNTTTQKHKYYYKDTGKPASAFAYYKYKIKTFFTNLGYGILVLLAIISILSHFTGIDLFGLFI